MISPAALQLILDYEVGGGEEYYRARLARPTWPGGASGVTIGIGYDLGYTGALRFAADWAALQRGVMSRLSRVIGLRGQAAKSVLPPLRDIVIPWEVALDVFRISSIGYWEGMTRHAFPGIERLPEDAYGALVGLTFNRGTSMAGERRREMREIRNALRTENPLPRIAQALRDMKRLWRGKGLDGLIARREAEAKLVERALA